MSDEKHKPRAKRHPLHGVAEILRGGGRCLDIISGRRFFWNNAVERQWLLDNWGDVAAEPDFPQRFLRLVSGMDGESADAVIRILLRERQIIASKRTLAGLDIYTSEEQEELRSLRDNFYSKIIKVSDDLFAWRNYLLPIRHFEAPVFYYRHGISTLKNPEFARGKAIVDAGGFIGDSVLVLSELGPSAIYTFEPVPDNFALLKRTLELNRVTNAVPENMALAAEDGFLKMRVAGSCSSSTPGIRPPKPEDQGKEIEVPARALDSYVAEHPMEIGLIKTDLEGAEPSFIAGAKKTICEQRPILLISIYHTAHDFFEIKPLIESWGLGYRFSIHKPAFAWATGDTLLVAEPGA